MYKRFLSTQKSMPSGPSGGQMISKGIGPSGGAGPQGGFPPGMQTGMPSQPTHPSYLHKSAEDSRKAYEQMQEAIKKQQEAHRKAMETIRNPRT
jgi:hypothetical protein